MWRELLSRPRAQIFAALTITLLATGSQAAQVLVVASADKDHYRRAAAALAAATTLRVETRFLPDGGVFDDKPRIIIALGILAARRVMSRNPVQPWVAALISARSHAQLLGEPTDSRPPAAVLLLDQPLRRQIDIARYLLPQIQRIGALITPASETQLPQVAGIEIVTRKVSPESNIVLELDALLRETDGLLAVPDKQVFNRNTIHGVLLSAYRLGKPVIGYSKPLVKAGALLSAYSTPEQLGAQAGALISELLAYSTPGTRIVYPDEFRIVVNHGIGRALGLPPLDASIETRVFHHSGQLR